MPRARLIRYRSQLRGYEDAKRAEVESLDLEVLRLREETRRLWVDIGIDGSIFVGGLVVSGATGPGGFVMAGLALYRLTNHTMKSALRSRDALQSAAAKIKAVESLLRDADWRLTLIEDLM